MAKQNQIEQNKTSDIAQIDAERSALSAKVQGLLTELAEMDTKIKTIDENKDQGKQAYNEALDAGSEELMTESLRRIRRSNEDRQRLLADLNSFSEKFSNLQASYEALVGKARTCRITREKELESFRAEYRRAEACQDRCHGLLNQLNDVEQAMNEMQNAYNLHATSGAEN